ncbi:hypothetical protein MAP00_008333 [Monascus purpureus]|nr:hypothetical protein MAP00_008333 [Monascus purpureus]
MCVQYGKLSDIYGRKPVLLMAYFLFSVGCVIGYAAYSMKPVFHFLDIAEQHNSAFAREIWQVILGRAISGIGGAGLITVGSVIVTDLVPKREIASWRAYINIAMTLGRSLGGPAGGWLTDSIGWRWLFLIQAPFFWISMLLTGLKLKLTIPPASKPTEHNDDDDINANSNNNPTRSKFKRIDFLGMTCLALSTSAIILLLDAGGNKFPWTAPISISLLTTAIIFFIAFILVEAYIAPEPLFALRILRQPNVLPSYLVMTLQGIAQISMMYCIPLYFQVTSSASTSVAGAHLVPAVVGNALAGLATGATIKRTGRFKALAVSAGLVASVTYILIFFSWNGHTSFWESLYIIPGGMGMGMAQASVFVSMTSMLDAKYMAMATGGLFLFTNLGISSGITVSNAALDAGFRRALEREFTGDGADQFIHKVTSNVHYISGLTGHVKEVVVSCYADGLKRTHIISLACSVAASAFALTIRNQQL